MGYFENLGIFGNVKRYKGRFARYDFVARDNFTTGLRHVLGPFTRERHFHLQN